MTLTDKKYPLCSKLNLLRRSNQRRLCVSTSAMHNALGWQVYRRYLPTMRHKYYSAGPTPESAEAFLRGLNGELK